MSYTNVPQTVPWTGQQYGNESLRSLTDYVQQKLQEQPQTNWYPAILCGTPSITLTEPMSFSGNRYVVICNGQAIELPEDATLEAAQEKAEQQAHKHQSEAYILKPVRKVAPKRDVVTTDL